MGGSIYQKLTSHYRNELLQNIKLWCSINSQYDEESVDEDNPFGKGVSKALNFFAELAQKSGLKVNNYDNYVVEALYGDGPKNLTIMAHADVVPEGSGWSHNPFEVMEKKGVLYGRGVADDKGPALACFYALKALIDNNMLSKDYQIRFLVGGNEERGSLCMEHYFKELKKPQPTCGFSPDSSFPLIFAEKGIFNFEASKKIYTPGLISIHGGLASNAVIERCVVKFELNENIIPFLVKYYPEAIINTNEDVVKITFVGVAAHGSIPQAGKNAGMMALDFLAKYTKDPDFVKALELFSDVYGKGVNAFNISQDMGKNSLNVGLINYERGGILSLVINFRYVNGVDDKKTKANIKEACKPFSVKCSPSAPLVYFKKTSPLVKHLMNAYIKETGDTKAKPLSTGGGTYAKEANNIVAFGMEFPGRDPKMHAVGENVSIDDLMLSMSIYARAIDELGKALHENKI